MDSLLTVSYVQGVLGKVLLVALFVKRLGKSLINFVSTWDNVLKVRISTELLPMEGYIQGALRKELHIAPFCKAL